MDIVYWLVRCGGKVGPARTFVSGLGGSMPGAILNKSLTPISGLYDLSP